MTATPWVETVMYQRADSTLSRRVGDSLLLLVRGSAEVLHVSGPGVALWDTLDLPLPADATARLLADTYGVDVATVQRDIDPVLDDLVDRGALHRLGRPR